MYRYVDEDGTKKKTEKYFYVPIKWSCLGCARGQMRINCTVRCVSLTVPVLNLSRSLGCVDTTAEPLNNYVLRMFGTAVNMMLHMRRYCYNDSTSVCINTVANGFQSLLYQSWQLKSEGNLKMKVLLNNQKSLLTF